MAGRFSEEWELARGVTPTEGLAGLTALNGAILDMLGYSELVVIVPLGAITGGAVTSIKLQQGAVANMSDAADLAGTGQVIADTEDDGVRYLDVKWDRPMKRYVRVVVTRGTQNATVAAVYLRRRRRSAVQPAGVTGELHTSPAEGTA